MKNIIFFACLTAFIARVNGFLGFKIPPIPSYINKQALLSPLIAASLFLGPTVEVARAGIDPAVLQKYVETQSALDSRDTPFTELPSGVSYREFRSGKGERTVGVGKTVTVRLTARAKTLFTPKDPGGVKYFDSQIDGVEKDVEGNGVLSWVIGSEDSPVPIGLEEAMTAGGGMKRNSIRRVDIPSVQIFRARKDNRLPQPSEKNDEGKRIYQKLFKTKGDTIFEVLVEKIAE